MLPAKSPKSSFVTTKFKFELKYETILFFVYTALEPKGLQVSSCYVEGRCILRSKFSLPPFH